MQLELNIAEWRIFQADTCARMAQFRYTPKLWPEERAIVQAMFLDRCTARAAANEIMSRRMDACRADTVPVG